MSENMKLCYNCDTEVPESKFILHEPYCLKNVKKCELCQEVIHMEEVEDHNKEYHTDVPCKFCQNGFPRKKLIEHMSKCDEKPTECKYCKLHVSVKEKKDHEYVCGSKTEYCNDCKKYIPIKDFESHKDISCYPDETYLSNHLNVEKIPLIMKKRNTKVGLIGTASKLGLLNINNDKKTTQTEKEGKDIHKELKEKINKLDNQTLNKIVQAPIEKKKMEKNNKLREINIPQNYQSLKEDNKGREIVSKNINYNEMMNDNYYPDNSKLKEDNKPREILSSKKINYNEMINDNYHTEIHKFKEIDKKKKNGKANSGSTFNEISGNLNSRMHLNNNKVIINQNPSNELTNNTKYSSRQDHITGKVVKAGNVKAVVSSNIPFPTNTKIVIDNNSKINTKTNNPEEMKNTMAHNNNVKKMPYTRHVEKENNSNALISSNNAQLSTNNKNPDEINIISENKVNFNENLKNKEDKRQSKKMISEIDDNENNKKHKNFKKKSNKATYESQRYNNDYFSDDYIADEEIFKHNNKYQNKNKSKHYGNTKNIEDDVLKKVIEMSKNNY